MASMSTDAKGNRRVLFMAADGQRRQVRLGGVPKKTANTIKARIESRAARLLPTFLFGRRPIPRVVEIIGAIGSRLLLGLFSEAFGLELTNFGLGLIEFGLQLCVSIHRASMRALPIAQFAA